MKAKPPILRDSQQFNEPDMVSYCLTNVSMTFAPISTALATSKHGLHAGR